MVKFKKLVREMFSNNQPFQKAIDSFGSKYEGMVLQSIIIESDKLYEESEEEVITEIRKKIPEAIIISHTMLKLTKA
jgi:DNA-binding HxlR family transcriptional regulator